MRKILEHFVKYGLYANLIIALTIILGVIGIHFTKLSFFPERESNYVSVSVSYPGASPQEMEEGITTRIEESIQKVVGIKEVTSRSRENFASVNIEVEEDYDRDEAYLEVKNAIDQINSFPAGAERPVVRKSKSRSPAIYLGLTSESPGTNLFDLKRYAEDIESAFLRSGVITEIDISGYPNVEISIEPSEENLREYGMTLGELAAAVRTNNRDISGGSIKTQQEELLIRYRGKENRTDFIEQIVVRTNTDGSVVRVGDLATVTEQFADVPNVSYMNGQPAVYIAVSRLFNEDLQKITEFVRDYAEEFNAKHNDAKLHISFSFLDMLNQRLEMLIENGVVGLLLVLFGLGLFLSIRLSFWVAWGIPSSFLGLFIVGSFVGLTINMISLFGMILVIGILVDDGIVIAENIYAHFERGKSPAKAAVDGTLEVVPSVTTSVLTTIIAFTPLLLLTGGFEFLRDMGLVVILTLAFSLIEAFFVLPAHLGHPGVLEKMKAKRLRGYYGWRKKIDQGFVYLRDNIYGKILTKAINYWGITVGGVLLLIFMTFGFFSAGWIKATFFPVIPFNSIDAEIAFTPGTRETTTLRYLQKFEQIIWEVNEELKGELEDSASIINYTFVNVGNAGNLEENGGHAGSISILFKEIKDSPVNGVELASKIRERIGNVPEIEKMFVGQRSRFGNPVSVRLLSSDSEQLSLAKDLLKAQLENVEDLKDVKDNQPVGMRELVFELKPKAKFLGFTQGQIAQEIRRAFFGEEAQRLLIGDDEVRIYVRYPKNERVSLGNLENMRIIRGREEYSIDELIDYRIDRGISDIRHFQGEQVVEVDAQLIDPFAELPPIIENVRENIVPAVQAKVPNVRFEFGGQSEESAESMQQILLFFGGAFAAMFITIMITFRSFYQALMILMMIPLGWIGSAWGHGIHDKPVSILSAWGMIALSGVIINDAVVFLDRFNTHLKEGMTVKNAAFQAGKDRFRPILLTSITTIFGLYPLILETSFQAQFLIPMAISVAWGVLVGTLLILLFFPVLIVGINRIRFAYKTTWDTMMGRKTISRYEEAERVVIDLKKGTSLDDLERHAAEEAGNTIVLEKH